MAREFTNGFYGRAPWKKTAADYKKAKIFCERCERQGRLGVPGQIVHHKIELTSMNINDPTITLNWNNLELLCRDCHALVHGGRDRQRYKLTATGELIIGDADEEG